MGALYLAAYARPPRSEERTRWVGYLTSGEPDKGRREALADLLWVLLNSSEFLFNR